MVLKHSKFIIVIREINIKLWKSESIKAYYLGKFNRNTTFLNGVEEREITEIVKKLIVKIKIDWQ